MDSTMIYHHIYGGIRKKELLKSILPQLITSELSSASIKLENMTDEQILAQVYTKSKKIANGLSRQILPLIREDQQNNDNSRQSNPKLQKKKIYQEEDLIDEVEESSEQINLEKRDQENSSQSQIREEIYEGQNDVGLYGEELDEEELESYENEGNSEEERQFESDSKRKITKKNVASEEEEDDLIQQNFDHFREIELQNQKLQTKIVPQLDRNIDRLENKIINKKDWVLKGQVKANERPVNSLLEHSLQFKSGIKYSHEITPQSNDQLEKTIKKRIFDELFDDRVKFIITPALQQNFGSLKDVNTQKSKKGLAEIYELQFKNNLGLGENKNDRLKKEIFDDFKLINYYLDSLTNFNYTPKLNLSKINGNKESLISQENVPITAWNGNHQPSVNAKGKFQSNKQINTKLKRSKNKKIARTRAKEAARKKLDKQIEYGGMTKFQAKTMKKIAKNKNNSTAQIKYNKSTRFFKSMNDSAKNKPNANISKMKM